MKITSLDIDILARTIYGEARGETAQGKIAVGYVVVNRVKKKSWYGRTIRDVCRYPYQFSCWNDGDPNLPKIQAVDLNDPLFQECYYAALSAALGKIPDPTSRSTHYHTTAINPSWAKGHEPVCIIGSHKFYDSVK